MGNNKCCGDYTDDQQWCIVNDNKMRLAMTDVATNDDQEFDKAGEYPNWFNSIHSLTKM